MTGLNWNCRSYGRILRLDEEAFENAGKGVKFARELGDMQWGLREFVVKDCDGRLLAFGSKFIIASALCLIPLQL
jgi:hypothetical protein